MTRALNTMIIQCGPFPLCLGNEICTLRLCREKRGIFFIIIVTLVTMNY